MKITKIRIKNFRSIKEETIVFPKSGILALVGANNAGKSNILRAIDNLLGDSWFSVERANNNDFWMKKEENKIEIEINFDNDRKVSLSSNDKWPQYTQNGKRIGSWNRDTTGDVKKDFPCTYLSANRDLGKNLQFREYELMGKIAKQFNLRVNGEKKEELETKFEEVMNILEDVDGFLSFKSDFVEFFNQLQCDTPYRLKVDFKAFSPNDYFKTLNICANDSSINGEYDVSINELGEGNKSLVLFALIRSYAKNFKKEATGILAIEEPEIYLHPQARRHLFSIFKEIVEESDIQIIYTTHSPDFLSTEEFSSIGLVSKDPKEGTKVKIVTEEELVEFSLKTGVPNDKTNVSNIKDFYSVTSDFRLNEGFFAKKLVLVEGDTEELCFPLLIKRLGFDSSYEGVSIIGVEGKNKIPKYWRLFYSFDIPLLVVFDSDKEGNHNLAKCFNCEERHIQDNVNVVKELKTKKENIFEQKVYVLEVDFETALKKDFCKYIDQQKNELSGTGEDIWLKLEEEANEHIKPIMRNKNGNKKPDQSKGQLARYIVRKLLSEYPQYKPTFLDQLVETLEV